MADCLPAEKIASLQAQLRDMERVVVAFSGGTDSSLLLYYAARALSTENVCAVTLSVPYTPAEELEMAAELARQLQVRHQVLELPFPEELRQNPADRCYLCKKYLFASLLAWASDCGAGVVLDGTNFDDLSEHRPGQRALQELGIISPLQKCGLVKSEIRLAARQAGLANWNKPANSCLLTRIPHGHTIDEQELRRINQAESLLHAAGFATVRVRSYGALVRVEVPRDQLAKLVSESMRHKLDEQIRQLGYRHVTVDLAGYQTGSMDETVKEGLWTLTISSGKS